MKRGQQAGLKKLFEKSGDVGEGGVQKHSKMANVFYGCYTPPIAEILCVKNVGAFVVCGFLMK